MNIWSTSTMRGAQKQLSNCVIPLRHLPACHHQTNTINLLGQQIYYTHTYIHNVIVYIKLYVHIFVFAWRMPTFHNEFRKSLTYIFITSVSVILLLFFFFLFVLRLISPPCCRYGCRCGRYLWQLKVDHNGQLIATLAVCIEVFHKFIEYREQLSKSKS